MYKITEQPYYELNIENFEEIRREVYNIINKKKDLKTDVSYITPRNLFEKAELLQNMLDLIEIKDKSLCRYLTVIVNPGEQLHPHVDSTENSWNLLLPISNTEGTILSFYESPTGPVLIDRYNERGEYVPYYAFEQDKCIEKYSITLTKPTFINAHMIHGVINNVSGKQRQTVSIHMHGNFHPLDIPERFLANV